MGRDGNGTTLPRVAAPVATLIFGTLSPPAEDPATFQGQTTRKVDWGRIPTHSESLGATLKTCFYVPSVPQAELTVLTLGLL